MSEEIGREVRRRAISGLRWVAILNLATLPMSFLTNVAFARVSPELLGSYAAVQIYIAGFQALVVLGGAYVFTRLVPRIERAARASFLATYAAIVGAIALAVGALATGADGGWTSDQLVRLGRPAAIVLSCLSAAVVLWAFASHFLYAVLEAGRAALTLKSVVAGYFLAGVAAVTAFRGVADADPAAFMWSSSLAIYVLAAAIGGGFLLTNADIRGRGPWRWMLPRGFWSLALYTHVQTLVVFCYTSLSPYVVLVWLDTSSLGVFHAALRYPGVLALVPVMMASVLAPGMATLDASGDRPAAVRQASASLGVSALATVPLVLALVLFAEDAMGVFGAEYREHAGLLRVVALSALARPSMDLGSGLLVALGFHRAFVGASLIYVAAALGFTVALVPPYGLTGAAWAATLGTAVQAAAVHVVARVRLGLPVGARTWAGWGTGVASLALASALAPGRVAAAALLAALLAAFAILGRVSRREVADLGLRLLGRR